MAALRTKARRGRVGLRTMSWLGPGGAYFGNQITKLGQLSNSLFLNWVDE